jgi:hypothetical protein
VSVNSQQQARTSTVLSYGSLCVSVTNLGASVVKHLKEHFTTETQRIHRDTENSKFGPYQRTAARNLLVLIGFF